MRIALAEKLLAKIMNWSPDEISKERPLIQALANFKYDEYQQFNPGIRYIESLMRWLNQFEPAERVIAYDFIKSNLIFISNEQINHLVNIAYSQVVNPFIIEKTASGIGESKYAVNRIITKEEYKKNLKQSLFIGLSDGSRIDQFRRSSGINNEQVSTTYNISPEKAKEMIKDLGTNEKFTSIFLIDDFTASGKSYFRPDEKKGKIYKFLSFLFNDDNGNIIKTESSLELLIDRDTFNLQIIFYIATNSALLAIDDAILAWKKENGKSFVHRVLAIQVLDDSIKNEIIAQSNFIVLSKKYFDSTIVDTHYKKGKHDEPHLGFNECALPLVLHHNTPNNSLPILWFTDDKDKKGLFPRITRHKE